MKEGILFILLLLSSHYFVLWFVIRSVPPIFLVFHYGQKPQYYQWGHNIIVFGQICLLMFSVNSSYMFHVSSYMGSLLLTLTIPFGPLYLTFLLTSPIYLPRVTRKVRPLSRTTYRTFLSVPAFPNILISLSALRVYFLPRLSTGIS